MDQRKCIFHYDIKNTKYRDIKEISSVNIEKIYWAKSICESLGGKNHTDLCQLIPEEFDPVEHGIHLVPRCKKFTLILSKEKDCSSANFNNESLLTEPRPKRVKTSHVSNVYPKECNFCKKYRTMKKNKIHFPKTLCTDKAVQTIKDAAQSKEHQSLCFEIKDADLIAREFKYNENCYKEYTRKTILKQAGNELSRSLGDFDQVKKCIEEKILSQNQPISMSILHVLNGVHSEDTRYRKRCCRCKHR